MDSFKKKMIMGGALAIFLSGVALWQQYSRPVKKGPSIEVINEMAQYLEDAEAGDAKAQFKVGMFYENGKAGYLKQDIPSAAMWYREAARKGHLEAQEKLADILYHGRGLPINYAEARIWYIKAAEQGSTKAQIKMGHIFQEGKGVRPDLSQSIQWYTMAAEQNSPEAIKELEAIKKEAKKQDDEAFERQYQSR